jgi:hypothetical protein
MHLDPAAGNAFAPGYVFLPIGAHLVHEPLPLLAGLRGLLGDDEVSLDVLEAVITLDSLASLSVAWRSIFRSPASGHRTANRFEYASGRMGAPGASTRTRPVSG